MMAQQLTYSIGSSSALSLQQPLFYAAKWGGFIDTDDDNKPNLTAEWDAVNNTTGASGSDGIPDRYFIATNPKELATSLENALSNVLLTSGSSASVTANSTRLDTNTVIYQAKFNSADWTGQLLAYPIGDKGVIATNFTWDAGQKVTAQGMNGRSIFSYNPTASSTKGIAFQWDKLINSEIACRRPSQYLRGDQRTTPVCCANAQANALLGDLVNSDPWFISSTRNFGYDKLPETEGSSYLTFRNSAAYKARTPMVAIGGNDGMLHVFNANITGTGGNELFAYVPHTVLADLPAFTSPTYLSSGQHKYFVDGAPIAGDAYFNADDRGPKVWRTALV
jgi:type IV pilus assembly protein PilY1